MFQSSKPIQDDSNIHYARSRLLGLFSFLELSKKDAAILWAGLNYIDKYKNESIQVKEFANVFCPKYVALFIKMYDKYTYAPKSANFKAKLDTPDDDDATLGMDADALMAHMAKGEAEQAAAKEAFEKAAKEKKEKEMKERHRPDYVKFLCFFMFFMSINEQDMPLWIYWLWWGLPKIKPSKENIHSFVSKIWDPENFNLSWYEGEVKYIVKVVDPSFNARTFQLTDQRVGGAWSIPFHEMRQEIYSNFDQRIFFDRVTKGFTHALHNPEMAMLKMKDTRLKGAPEDHTTKGDRSIIRHDIRSFIHHYRAYINQPMDESETFSEGNCLASIATMCGLGLKRVFRPCINCWEKIAPKEIDMSMGMGTEGYARPKSRGLLSKLKQEMDEKEGKEVARKLTPDEEDSLAMKKAEEEREEERRRLVPLEYKYRKQLELPPRVLNHKAAEMRAEGKRLLEKVKLEVVDEATIMSKFDDEFMSTLIDISALEDLESEDGLNSLNTKDDDDSINDWGVQ
jgi:hypothetical protein